MFGIGGSEIIVILVLALIFLGPDKLPDAAKQISKGIRDLKKHGRVLQRTIEDDEHIGGAIRDIKSALRGDEIMAAANAPVKKRRKKRPLGAAAVAAGATAAALPEGSEPTIPATEAAAGGEPADPVTVAVASDGDHGAAPAKPVVTLPLHAGEPDEDAPRPSNADDAELAAMIRPAAGTIAKSSPAPTKAEPEHG